MRSALGRTSLQSIPALLLAMATCALGQAGSLSLPKTVEAGTAFSIPTTGSGKGTFYLAGLGQVIKRDVDLGQPVSFAVGDITSAGHYIVILASGSSPNASVFEKGEFDVLPAAQVATVNFLAKPSRISVGLHGGISGAVYLFDAYQNLVTRPTPVSFQLSVASGTPQARTATTRDGAAWTTMDSAAKEGAAQFVAKSGDISTTRVIQEVPGEPCGLHMNAKPADHGRIELQTDPLKDCGGNAVPDGTIVTFTEAFNGTLTTVDVPLKRGIAQAELPAYPGARITAATGVVLGNEIRWGGR